MMSSNWNSIEVELSSSIHRNIKHHETFFCIKDYIWYSRIIRVLCQINWTKFVNFSNFYEFWKRYLWILFMTLMWKQVLRFYFIFSFIACKRLNNYHYSNFTQRLFNFMFLDIILYVIYYTRIKIFMFYFILKNMKI